jgi:hypothetical protein
MRIRVKRQRRNAAGANATRPPLLFFFAFCWPSQESLKRSVFPAHPTISPASSMGVVLLAYVPLRFLPVYLYRITGEIIFCFLFCFVLFVKNQITGRGVARDLKGKGKPTPSSSSSSLLELISFLFVDYTRE